MPPSIYWLWNRYGIAELSIRGGCEINYVSTRDRDELEDAATLEENRPLYEEIPINTLAETSRSGCASEKLHHTGAFGTGGQCLSWIVKNNPHATLYESGRLGELRKAMEERNENPHTMRHKIPFTGYQMLLYQYLGLDIMAIWDTTELKSNADIVAAENALQHQFLEQHYDGHRHEWTPMEVMTRMEELLAVYAPAILAKVKRTGSFDLLSTAEIIDYCVNSSEELVVDQVKFCIEISVLPVMNNGFWLEKCYN